MKNGNRDDARNTTNKNNDLSMADGKKKNCTIQSGKENDYLVVNANARK